MNGGMWGNMNRINICWVVCICVVCAACLRIEEDVTGRGLPRYQTISQSTLVFKTGVFLIEDRDNNELYVCPPGKRQDSAAALSDFHGFPMRCGFGEHTFIIGIVEEGVKARVDRIIEVTHPENGQFNIVIGRLLTGDRRGKTIHLESLLRRTGQSHVFSEQKLVPDARYLGVVDGK